MEVFAESLRTKLETWESKMNYASDYKARLFFTYLKDKTELFLYVKPIGTSGSEMVYRRTPGDAAMNLRIRAIFENVGIPALSTEIWILLYPPEIHTTTLYIPAHASRREVRALIREQLLVSLPYSVNYDWDNYSLRVHDNGNEENMVTVTILGKHVLPRIQELLKDNFNNVTFFGDGLQFLNVGETFCPYMKHQTYKVILPYDEIYFHAGFRSGIHVDSSVLTHACSSSFGAYKLRNQQVYIDFRHEKRVDFQPQMQPIVPTAMWKDALLTPSAFPTWFIAHNSMHEQDLINFVGKTGSQKKQNGQKIKRRKISALHLLN